MDELIAVRIKDGIFVGNSGAAADQAFLMMNKITHIINCAGAEIGDFFLGEPEFRYLSFPWKDAAGSVCTTILFDAADDTISRTVQFIDEALDAGECVLVHSVYGNSRSPALVAAYLIVKYGWKLESALQFLRVAHPDADIKPHFQRQLRQFAKRHDVDRDVFAQDVDDSHFGLDNDQWMLRNTLLNGLLYNEQLASGLYRQCAEKVDVGTATNVVVPRARICFVDTKKGTHVESRTSCPVVPCAEPFQTNPEAAEPGGFLGSRGSSALRSGRRSPSILSRSTSPCARRLESDPRICPKGRQVLPVVLTGASETTTSAPARTAERATVLRTTPVSIFRTSSSSSHLSDKSPRGKENGNGVESSPQPRQWNGGSARSIDYTRLVPPAPQRSPFSALGSSHRYRNGSPLPLQKGSNVLAKGAHTRIPSSPTNRPVGTSSLSQMASPTMVYGGGGSLSNTNSPASMKTATTLTKSSLTTNKPTRDTIGRPSAASYRGIAPSRSAVFPRSEEVSYRGSGVVYQSSPRYSTDRTPTSRTSSRHRTSSPIPSATKRSNSAGRAATSAVEKPRSRTRSPQTQKYRDPLSRSFNTSFSNWDTNLGAGGAASKKPAIVRRQPPTVISSRRQD